MKLSVLTPGETVFEGDIVSVRVPGISGSFEILKDHAPIVSALGEGMVYFKEESGSEHQYKIHKGFLEVLRNEISLLVQGLQPV